MSGMNRAEIRLRRPDSHLMKTVRGEWHVLTGSYALDALSNKEREGFERHLHHCAPCDAEVRGLRETAARLAMARSLRPPPELQDRVLAATHRTRQLPPAPGRPLGRIPAPRLLASRLAAAMRRIILVR
jgi:anti-sigma factor RsiW